MASRNLHPEQTVDFRQELIVQTQDFARHAAQLAEAMFSTPFTVKNVDCLEEGLRDQEMIFISILFTGTVYGEYVIAVDEATAKRLVEAATDGLGFESGDGAIDLLREFLNVTVGESIVHLGKSYEKLTVTAPRVISGAVTYPRIPMGRAVLTSERGNLFCYLMIDRMRLDIATSYKDALNSLTKAHKELQEAMRKLQDHQAMMVHSEKMAAVGTMAAGVAHEINTPLATVSLLGGMIRQYTQVDPINRPGLVKALESVDTTIARISKITKSMGAMAHGVRNGKVTATSVHKLFEDALIFCETRMQDGGIRIDRNIPETLAVECRAPQMVQGLLNILNNAIDAVESLSDRWIRITVVEDKGDVLISITDSGGGIAEAVRERIFDPFFTTRDVGKGTGLGLTMSMGIIREHGGKLRVDADSENTCMEIRLPKQQAKCEAA